MVAELLLPLLEPMLEVEGRLDIRFSLAWEIFSIPERAALPALDMAGDVELKAQLGMDRVVSRGRGSHGVLVRVGL